MLEVKYVEKFQEKLCKIFMSLFYALEFSSCIAQFFRISRGEALLCYIQSKQVYQCDQLVTSRTFFKVIQVGSYLNTQLVSSLQLVMQIATQPSQLKAAISKYFNKKRFRRISKILFLYNKQIFYHIYQFFSYFPCKILY